MKKLLTLCFLIATTFTAIAQDKKPTKEETITFIKSYFENKAIGGACSDGDYSFYYSREISYSDYSLSFEDNILVVEYKWNLDVTTSMDGKEYPKESQSENHKIKIDLSKIELVSVYVGGLHQHCEDKKIVRVEAGFKSAPSFKSTKTVDGLSTKSDLVILPINAYRCDGCDNEAENKKIIQAFNHLSKLCGAKEEINFDGK